MHARSLMGWVVVAAFAHASPPLPTVAELAPPMTRTSSPMLRWSMNPPFCPGLELLLYEVRLIEAPRARELKRSATTYDDVRVTMLVSLPQGCAQLPSLVVPAQRGLFPSRVNSMSYAPPPRIVEARGLLVAGTARFEFGWAGEPRRVSVDLHTGEARLEENGLTLASAGSFREWKAVDAPKYVRHAMGVRLPGVVSQPVEAPGHTCLRYFDLAIDDVFVVRRTLVDGTVYDQVAVEAGFLQSEASAPIDCRMRSVATPVQLEVESGFVVQPVASSRSAYFAIAFSGTDRVVRRFHVTPGTQTVRLVFSENDVVEVDLERGTARVLRISAVKTAEVPGPHDVRKLWESRETDRAGYLRTTYLRSHTTRARGADICGELKMGIEPTYVPSGEAEALWELRAALECE